jgi:hypothetical protein
MAIPKFKNEPLVDFSKPASRKKQESAIAALRGSLGREYPMVIGGERILASQKFSSFNPSRSAEVVGVFQKGDADTAARAMNAGAYGVRRMEERPFRAEGGMPVQGGAHHAEEPVGTERPS